MNKGLLLRVAILLPLIVMPVFGQSVQDRVEKSTHNFRAGGSLTIKPYKGSLRLTSWDRNEVEVVARISAPRDVSDDYARRAIQATRIEVRGGDNSLLVQSNYDDVPENDDKGPNWRTLPQVHFEVRAPRSISLNINADISKIDFSGFEGKIALDTDRSDIKGSDLAGEIRLHMDRGDAWLSDVKGKVEVQSDRGEVSLDRVSISTDSRLETDRGGISLKLSGPQGLSLKGHIAKMNNFHSDFPVQMRTLRGRVIEGTINGGGPELYVKADRGKIRLMQ
jgi:hypothetical protein